MKDDEIVIPCTHSIYEEVIGFFREFDSSEFNNGVDDVEISCLTVTKDNDRYHAFMSVILYGSQARCIYYNEGDHRNVAPESEWDWTEFEMGFDFDSDILTLDMTVHDVLDHLFRDMVNTRGGDGKGFEDEMYELTHDIGLGE